MGFRHAAFDFNELIDQVVLTGIESFNYRAHDFSYWRDDCYGNSYLSDDGYFQVVPEDAQIKDFPELMKHHMAHLVNLSALEASGINVPEYEIGIYEEDDCIRPYTVMERPQGTPLSDSMEVLGGSDWGQRFEKMNQRGRRLSNENEIIYPNERENRDVIIDPELEELVYINPGTFVEGAFFNQFSRSDSVPSNRMELGKWLSESFWTDKMK